MARVEARSRACAGGVWGTTGHAIAVGAATLIVVARAPMAPCSAERSSRGAVRSTPVERTLRFTGEEGWDRVGRTATITVMVTDLVGSTALLRFGPEAFDEIRRAHLDAVREAIEVNGGTVVKSTGDGILGTFTSAADAATAACGVQVAVALLRSKDPRHPAVRVGVASGEATSEDGDWYGRPVIEAARLCAAADGGQILAGAVVQALVGGRRGHRFVRHDDLLLKGFDEATPVVEITWSAPERRDPIPHAAGAAISGPLVDREEALAHVLSVWKEAAVGERRAVLVSGEPGVGKTRLVAEVAAIAHAEGGLVLWGRCDEDLAVAYQPFAEAVRGWLPFGDAAAVDEVIAGDLARMLPELARSDIPLPPVGDPEEERQRLAAALDRLLVRLTEGAPVVLVLDDLHWASAPTLSLLRHVVRGTSRLPLLILGTYRNTELDRTHPLATVLADLRREEAVSRVSLDGLSVDGVQRFMEEAAGHDLGTDGESLAAAIHQETAGNPFFVGQVLQHLAETGAVKQVDGRWSTSVPLADLGLPEGVREVVGRRLSALSDEANTALQVAAVIGQEFELATIEAVIGGGDDVLSAIEAALRVRLVREAEGSTGRFAFVHAIVRQTLLTELTAARRARLHRRIGVALAARAHPDPLQCAHHFIEGAAAGAVIEAARWTAEAIEPRWQGMPPEEAVLLADRALQALDLADDPLDRPRAILLARKAMHIQFQGGTDEAKALADVAISVALHTGDPAVMLDAVEARVAWGRAGVPDPEAGVVLEQAIGMPGVNGLHLARLLSIRALWRAVNQGEGPAADDDARRSAELAWEHVGDHWLVRILATRALVLQGSSDVSLQRSVLDETRCAIERVPAAAISHAFDLERIEVVLALQSGDREAFDAALGGNPLLPRQDRIVEAMRSMWRAMAALLEGRFDDAEVHANGLLQVNSDVNFQNSWAALLFRVAHERGTAAALVPMVEDAIAATPGLVVLRTLLAEAYVEAERLDEAAALLADLAADDLAQIPRDTTFSASLAQLAGVAAAVGDAKAAAAVHRALLPYAGQLVVVAWGVFCYGAADRHLALCASLLGRADEAEERFAAAVALEESVGGVALASRTRYWWGRSALGRGDTQRARSLLEAARATASALSQARLATSAAELLQRIPP